MEYSFGVKIIWFLLLYWLWYTLKEFVTLRISQKRDFYLLFYQLIRQIYKKFRYFWIKTPNLIAIGSELRLFGGIQNFGEKLFHSYGIHIAHIRNWSVFLLIVWRYAKENWPKDKKSDWPKWQNAKSNLWLKIKRPNRAHIVGVRSRPFLLDLSVYYIILMTIG